MTSKSAVNAARARIAKGGSGGGGPVAAAPVIAHGGGGGGGPVRKPAVKTAKAAKKPKPKPMTAKQYASYLKYVNTHATAKARKWSPDDDLPVCAARAVAEAARLLSGQPWDDDQVLSLYWDTPHLADGSASILASLQCAGCNCTPYDISAPDAVTLLGLRLPGGHSHAVAAADGLWWSWGQPYEPWADAVVDEAWTVPWEAWVLS
jgi:hypothetical protein